MFHKKTSLASLTIVLVLSPGAARADRVLRTELVLAAPVEAVWNLWTTAEGITSFFAPGANVEPRVDGLYEIFFNPAAEPGKRGADGMRILAFEPRKRLSFTWNAPPSQPYGARGALISLQASTRRSSPPGRTPPRRTGSRGTSAPARCARGSCG